MTIATLADALEAERAKVAAARLEGWQPIETAPKDGTAILIACDYHRPNRSQVTLAWWEPRVRKWVESQHWDDCEDDWNFNTCAFRVTHWMPLPDHPEAPQ